MTHRLAGIDQERNPSLLGDGAQDLDWLDQPGVSRDPGHGQKTDARIAQLRTYRIRIHTAGGQVLHPFDDDPAPLSEREVGELIGDVIVASRDDDITRFEIERRQRLEKRDRRVLYQRNIARRCPYDSGDGPIGSLDGSALLVGELIATLFRFSLR